MPKINDIDNITFPVYKRLKKETKKEIKDAIEADKEIVLHLEYDYENKTITFPKGIVPLAIYFSTIYDGEDLFFDYENNRIIHETIGTVGSITVDQQVELTFEDELYDDTVQSLIYIAGSYDESLYLFNLNSYKLLHPAPNVEEAQSGTIVSGGVLGLDSNGKVVKGSISGGTKLYMHILSYDSLASSNKLYVIDTNSTKITISNYSTRFGEALNVYMKKAGYFTPLPEIIKGNTSGHYIESQFEADDCWCVSTLVSVSAIDDTVTPL